MKEPQSINAGNIYKKYSSTNPIVRKLMANFLSNLDELIIRTNPPKIHEIGCGEGHLISRYFDGRRILIASDYSKEIINEAIQNHSDMGIRFFNESIYDLSSDYEADCIICCEVLEHLEFPGKAIEVLSHLAKPYLIASVPDEPIWRFLNIIRGAYIKDLGNTPGHLNHWSSVQFLELLERKFDIIEVKKPFPWTMALCKVRE